MATAGTPVERPKKELPPKLKEHQWESTAPRRKAFLDLIANGLTIGQARAELNLPMDTYKSWRVRYPDFKAAVDSIRGADFSRQAPEIVELTDQSTFADRRWAYFGFESYWHHLQMIDAIENAPPGGVTMILLPPDHGKSTCIQDYISVAIGEDPNIRVCYLSGGLGLATKAVGRQQGRMDGAGAHRHPRFHADYGPFHEEGRDGKPWTATHFTVLKANHDEQDYTMEARPWTGNIAGSRVDLMIIDDIQELKSLNQTEIMLGRIRQDFMTRITRRKGKVIVIGTRVGDKDIYDALLREDLVDKLVALPATDGELVERCEMDILNDRWHDGELSNDRKSTLRKIPGILERGERLHPLQEKAWMAESEQVRMALMQLGDRQRVGPCDLPDVPHEKPLCPQMWPPHALARRRFKVGEDAWWRNFQQKPRNARDSVFTEDMIEGARAKLLTVAETIPRASRWRRFAGLDPSLTGGNTLVVCESNGFRFRPLHVRRDFRLTRTESIIDIIDAGWRTWRFDHLTIEENAFQKGLVNDRRLAEIARIRGFRLMPHTTGVNKADPDFGVASMAQMFKDDAVEWAWGDDESQRIFAVLETELLAWRQGVPTRKLRQDTVMALWFCWIWWQKRRKAWLDEDAAAADQWRSPRHLPWEPQGYAAVQRLSRMMA